MTIAEKIQNIRKDIPDRVVLCAVSKTKPVSDIMEAYHAGVRVFGENKVQELTAKYEAMPKDIEWHMIGHMQSNKVKYIAPFISLIHGVDNEKLLQVIQREGQKCCRSIRCLLQVHIATEESKFGFSAHELETVLTRSLLNELTHVEICGLMGMASFTDDQSQIQREFKSLKILFDRLRSTLFANNSDFRILSMGMSGDYHIAIQEGSTLVRIGSAIFGDREYL